MLRLKIEKAKVRVKGTFWGGGSIKAETIQTLCTGMETQLEIVSLEEPEKIAKLIGVAEAGCFVIQSLRNPVAVSLRASLNGEELELHPVGRPAS